MRTSRFEQSVNEENERLVFLVEKVCSQKIRLQKRIDSLEKTIERMRHILQENGIDDELEGVPFEAYEDRAKEVLGIETGWQREVCRQLASVKDGVITVWKNKGFVPFEEMHRLEKLAPALPPPSASDLTPAQKKRLRELISTKGSPDHTHKTFENIADIMNVEHPRSSRWSRGEIINYHNRKQLEG